MQNFSEIQALMKSDLEMTDEDLAEAFKKGKKAWGRSKIMIVGEGRAGINN